MNQKECSRCKDFKPLTEYFPNRATKDGLGGYCKPCKNAYERQRRITLRELGRRVR